MLSSAQAGGGGATTLQAGGGGAARLTWIVEAYPWLTLLFLSWHKLGFLNGLLSLKNPFS